MNIRRWLYSLTGYLFSPLILVRLLVKSFQVPTYRHHIYERFGFVDPLPKGEHCFWIHAVSVGEVQATTPLIRSLRNQYPEIAILVTTTTPTGAARLQEIHIQDPKVHHRYVPYDLPGVVKRFLNRIQPQLLIIMETELWPNLIYLCHARNLPVILANARLSTQSVQHYKWIPRLMYQTLNDLTLIAAQTQADASRFLDLGAPPERVQVMGNLKFDVTLPVNLQEEARNLRSLLGTDRPIWIAASTHEGEEEFLLMAQHLIRKHLSNALLILVPRHPERFKSVIAQCWRAGFPPVAWSEHRPVPTSCAVYLGDTMGRLPLFYAAADAAFIGGSLIPVGGHNPLEPAAVGIPLTTGPHWFNFEAIYHLLKAEGAVQFVDSPNTLATVILSWLLDPMLRQEIGIKGQRVVEKNRGALCHLMTCLKPFTQAIT